MTKNCSKILSLLLAVVMCVGMFTVFANAANTTFTDVPTGSWFYTAVMGCADKGHVSGVGNDQFMPEGKLTYAQIFTMFTNAFYKAEKQSYENDRYLEMDEYFGGEPQWWSYNAFYFNDNGLLKGADVNIQSTASANSPITRYDVVQIANNILKDKGITVSEAQKAEAQAKISDWSSVPSLYREAVSSCVALGIINGYSDHSFGGNDTLTRAQACVILDQLEKVVVAGPQSGDSGDSSTDGVLANGKPITEENVLAIMAEIEKEYPTGTIWAEPDVPGTKYNTTSIGDPLYNVLGNKYQLSIVYGCSGFAAMVSENIFGHTAPCYQLNDASELRPGDIIIAKTGSTIEHVMVAMGHTFTNDGFTGIYVADGNLNDHVMWPEKAENGDHNVRWLDPSNYTWEFWSRYPD